MAVTTPKAQTITVEFPGHALEFRVISDYSEYLGLKRGAQAFIANFPQVRSTPEWREFAKTEDEVLGLAFYFATTLVSASVNGAEVDRSSLTPAAFIRIAKDRANAFDKIREEINAGQFATIDAAQDQAVADAKKESSPTPDGITA